MCFVKKTFEKSQKKRSHFGFYNYYSLSLYKFFKETFITDIFMR